MMRKLEVFVCLIFLASCGKEDQKADAVPVSGEESCRAFDVASSREKAEDGELSAIRGMRDYYLDCVLHNNGPEALRWGKLAAEKGDDRDRATYESLKMTFVPKN